MRKDPGTLLKIYMINLILSHPQTKRYSFTKVTALETGHDQTLGDYWILAQNQHYFQERQDVPVRAGALRDQVMNGV